LSFLRYSNESQTVDIGVYITYDTDSQDTCEADNHTDTAVCVGSERTYRLVFGFVDIHCFDYHKVIIERYNGIEQCDENQYVEPCRSCRHKYEEFTEKSCKERSASEREYGKHHQ